MIRQTDYDDWYTATDGEGASLIAIDAFESDAVRLAAQASWRPSDQTNGSPGIAGIGAPGDFDDSGVIDINDVDLYYAETMGPMPPSEFDLTADGSVDNDDLELLIEDVLESRGGDSNLDGRVDFVDFLVLSLNFGKEDRNWSSGDFDADGTIGFADFLALSKNFGFAREA